MTARSVRNHKSSYETFEFEGALLLSWRDARQAFDPESEEATERVFKGSYQYSEVYDGWRPQVFLANESGSFNRKGIALRIEPDGTVWCVEELDRRCRWVFPMLYFVACPVLLVVTMAALN